MRTNRIVLGVVCGVVMSYGVCHSETISDVHTGDAATVEVIESVPPVAHEDLHTINIDPTLLQSDDPSENFEDQLPYYATAIALIKSQYVRPVSTRDLVQASLKGMALSLDPYCEYLDAEAFSALNTAVNGKYAGIGARIGARNSHVEVLAVLRNSPAEKAGLRVGDHIVRIDDVSVMHLPVIDVIDLLRGKEGSAVSLVVRTGDGDRRVSMKRAIVELDSVEPHQMVSEDVAYIRIVDFDHHTYKLLKKELKVLGKKGIAGLVLDLRNNAGGLLDASVDVLDLFLDEGALILSARNKEGVETLRFEASKKTYCSEMTIAVLVNHASASASEVMAGTLRDHGRALIVGERTFGKGSVQMVVPFPDKTALRLTTALYYLPSGNAIDGVGLEPDIVAPSGHVMFNEGDGAQYPLRNDAQVYAAYVAVKK